MDVFIFSCEYKFCKHSYRNSSNFFFSYATSLTYWYIGTLTGYYCLHPLITSSKLWLTKLLVLPTSDTDALARDLTCKSHDKVTIWRENLNVSLLH